MWLSTRCDFQFEIALPTPFVLMLRPRSGAQQWVAKEEYKLAPDTEAFEFTDHYGNLCQRLIAAPGSFAVYTAATVRVYEHAPPRPGGAFVEVQNLPDSVLCYLLPSRYCESDRLGQLATAITAGFTPGYDQVNAIHQWLYRQVAYLPGTSDVPISALEVYERSSGVCRDLAHLGIALCRSISIPARMVVGYLHKLEPMDLHAWFEAYVADRWYTFDATQSQPKQGYVAIGYGRDAADVAVYNQFGPPVHCLLQSVSVTQLEPDHP